MSVIERIRGGLIVSCQAEEGSPFYQPESMGKFARAAAFAWDTARKEFAETELTIEG